MQKDRINLSLSFGGRPLEKEELDELTNIGYYLEKGILFDRDYQKAEKIYKKCAAAGEENAINMLKKHRVNVAEKLDYDLRDLAGELGIATEK